MLSVASAAVVGMATLTGCSKVDDTLGSNLIPDDEQMRAGFISLPEITDKNPKKYVETRLFQTDSVLSANLPEGYLGLTNNDTLGRRSVGFLTQYTSGYLVDSGYFGYMPFFDSAQLVLSVAKYGSDTTTVQEFEIYEVITNDYLEKKPVASGKTERDTLFYVGFTPEKVSYLDNRSIINPNPLFTFTLGGDHGPSSTAVTLTPTAEGKEFVKRLMLQTGEFKDKYDIYDSKDVTKWLKAFEGLYIKPKIDPAAKGQGTIYALTLNSSALSIYGRNRHKDDPTLIKDTIGLVFPFRNTQYKEGNVSINVVERDYSTATATGVKVDLEEVREPEAGKEDNRPENPRVYVEGLGGVISEMSFGEEFFKALELRIEQENRASGQNFRTLAFNQALMTVFFPSSFYSWEEITPGNQDALIKEMNGAPQRLGLYLNYKTLEGIPDYAYSYEKNYEVTIPYDGYVNRSRGCYVMDITTYMQEVWNNYLEAKVAAGIDRKASYSEIDWEKIDWKKIKKRSVYIGPEAYDLFTSSFTILQGESSPEGASVVNNAPIRFELAYSLVK